MKKYSLFFMLFILPFLCFSQKIQSQTFTKKELSFIKNADSARLVRWRDVKENVTSLLPSPHVFRYLSISEEADKVDFNLMKNGAFYPTRILTKAERDSVLYFAKSVPALKPVTVELECKIAPMCGVQFFKKGKIFVLLFCFNCDVWALNRNSPGMEFSKKKIRFKSFYQVNYVFFPKEQRQNLINFAKNLFPNDKTFMSLK